MKYKVGDILKVKKGHENKCYHFNGDITSKFIKIINTKYDCYYYDILNKEKHKIGYCTSCFIDSDLEPIEEKTLYDLEDGDIIIHNDGYERMVLGVHSLIYHLSVKNDFSRSVIDMTPQELENEGYTIKGQEKKEVTEVTMEEVCKKFGKNVKIKE